MQLRSFRKAPVPAGGIVSSPHRDLGNEPVLNMEGIQGDVLLGHSKKAEAIIFFKITDPALFKSFIVGLPITSAAAVFRPDPDDSTKMAYLTGQAPPNPRFSVAFSMSGLTAIGADPGSGSLLDPLVQKLSGRAVAELKDADPSSWIVGKEEDDIDGVLIVTGAQKGDVESALSGKLGDPAGAGYLDVHKLIGNVREGDAEGHEHFGFLDGVSQPGIRGCVDQAQTVPLTENQNPNDPDQGLPGQDLLWPGEFVLGYSTQVAGTKFTTKGDPVDLPADWMKDGSFLVVRRLTQKVPEMHAGIKAATPPGQRPEQLEAQIVGRWPNGAPVVLRPDADDATLGTEPARNNDFEFGGDRHGLTCPWAAHIRKAYPRDDVRGNVAPADEEEIDAEEGNTQTHRMLRRGIQFGPEVSEEENASGQTAQDRGLLFKCYVADIADQFEFVQKLWCNNPAFAQPGSGHDSIIGQAAGGGPRTFAGVGYQGHKPSFTFQPWVEMTGGGYFFAPSIDFINSLEERVASA